MAMNQDVDGQFTEYLRDAARRAQAEFKYYPGFFHKMLNSGGGYQAAVTLLSPAKPVSEGFTKLWEAGRLDLSVEALVLHDDWANYFPPELIAVARKRLEGVGFPLPKQMLRDQKSAGSGPQMQVGEIYTREQLRVRFGITDSTLNTGVFRPKGLGAVWLFVTEDKTPDRTQYEDFLDGDVLYWQGQTSGRTDALIAEHKSNGLDLLVFYRRAKYEHAKAAFRLEGAFEYFAHRGSHPTSFVLTRKGGHPIAVVQAEVEQEGAFDPRSIKDNSKRVLSAIVQRRGQPVFRRALLDAYNNRCAISGCGTQAVLEAAHIFPYKGEQTNHVTNGLLLRADLHTLFDLGLFTIDERGVVNLSSMLLEGDYKWMQGKRIEQPKLAAMQPSKQALRWHRAQAAMSV